MSMNDSAEKTLYNELYHCFYRMRLTKKNEFYKRDKKDMEENLLYWKQRWLNDSVFPTDLEYAQFVINILYDKLNELSATEYKKFALDLLYYRE